MIQDRLRPLRSQETEDKIGIVGPSDDESERDIVTDSCRTTPVLGCQSDVCTDDLERLFGLDTNIVFGFRR